MQVGIIAEGKSDLAVLTNILKGSIGIDRSDITYLLPELEYDETDLTQMRTEQFSNWTIVKQKCEEGALIRGFLTGIDDNRFLVIHLDTAERFETNYEVESPQKEKTPEYVNQVRDAVKEKIKLWLSDNLYDRITFAIAVEETEAWLLTFFDSVSETGHYPNAKERFEKKYSNARISDKVRKQLHQKNAFDKYLEISKPFRKTSDLEQFCLRNQSLLLFYNDLKILVNQ